MLFSIWQVGNIIGTAAQTFTLCVLRNSQNIAFKIIRVTKSIAPHHTHDFHRHNTGINFGLSQKFNVEDEQKQYGGVIRSTVKVGATAHAPNSVKISCSKVVKQTKLLKLL